MTRLHARDKASAQGPAAKTSLPPPTVTSIVKHGGPRESHKSGTTPFSPAGHKASLKSVEAQECEFIYRMRPAQFRVRSDKNSRHILIILIEKRDGAVMH
jgi:hypothetical protein